MDDRRLELQKELEDVFGKGHVYYQPPESIRMKYPCCVYERRTADIRFANDLPYKYVQGYTVTIIDSNPDSKLPEIIGTRFPMIRYDRHFIADNLNHDVFQLYY